MIGQFSRMNEQTESTLQRGSYLVERFPANVFFLAPLQIDRDFLTRLKYLQRASLRERSLLIWEPGNRRAMPQATIDRLLADDNVVWLVPAGQEPFTIVSWYYRFENGMIFDNHCRDVFKSSFHKVRSTENFDIYTRD
jgi:hypothetical protein